MKTITLLLIATIFSSGILAQESDTTTVVKLDDIEVKIENDSYSISSPDMDTSLTIYLGKKQFIIGDRTDGKIDTIKFEIKKRKFNGHWAGVELGINNYVTRAGSMTLNDVDDFMELNTTKSLGININFMEFNIPIIKNNFGITTGMGMQINNYRLSNDIIIQQDNTPLISIISAADKKVSKYKLTTTYITVPLLLEFQKPLKKATNMDDENLEESDDKDGGMFYIAIGGYGGMRIGTHSKQVYEKNGADYKNKIRDDFNMSLFEYGVTARVGVSALKLFANYNLSTLFEKNEGPELYPFTAGVCFTF